MKLLLRSYIKDFQAGNVPSAAHKKARCVFVLCNVLKKENRHDEVFVNILQEFCQLCIAFFFSPQIFYLPLALVVPPSIFAVHIQLNLLYQFWIHTEVNI